mmetsp:Transcript_8111/g.15476  ORF Transcript_8111/g.15476 Transcript_8111/m.15476 type:complete len:287 (-) Transcript_8111:1815-2675(-)
MRAWSLKSQDFLRGFVNVHQGFLDITVNVVPDRQKVGQQHVLELENCIVIKSRALQLVVRPIKCLRILDVVVLKLITENGDRILKFFIEGVLIQSNAPSRMVAHERKHSLFDFVIALVKEISAGLFVAGLVSGYIRHGAERDDDIESSQDGCEDIRGLGVDKAKPQSCSSESSGLRERVRNILCFHHEVVNDHIHWRSLVEQRRRNPQVLASQKLCKIDNLLTDLVDSRPVETLEGQDVTLDLAPEVVLVGRDIVGPENHFFGFRGYRRVSFQNVHEARKDVLVPL